MFEALKTAPDRGKPLPVPRSLSCKQEQDYNRSPGNGAATL